ncbi:MAG: 3'(2'),5'-bisphosphate nucleotidase CysQ [Crocinitomicaceae bacterium]
MNESDLLKIAIEASVKASKRIMEIYLTEDFEIQSKEDDSPLTKADLAANKIICELLEKTEIPILSEEGKHLPYSERKSWEYLWIVDPIDGTKEFIKRNGEFTINIALVRNQVPILGVILVPVTQELYFSTSELGSYKCIATEINNDLERTIQIAKKLPLNNSTSPYIVAASISHQTKETVDYIDQLSIEHGEIQLISKGSSLKLCMVAEGTANCYPRFAPTMEWDTAAGHAICLNAGKDVIDMETKKSMLYNRERLTNNWFLVK